MAFVIVIPNFIGTIEDLAHVNKLHLISKEFDTLFNSLETSMNVNICLTDFVHYFHKKIIFTFIICLVEFITKLLLSSNTFLLSYTNYVMLIVTLYKNIAIVHATLFIDMQGLILASLNKKLNPLSEESAKDCLIMPVSVEKMLRDLPRIKAIHQHVWEISEILNQRFGCFLLSALLDTGVITIHMAMEVYIYLNSDNKISALRK